MGRRQALWDLETTKTTFNNNFILRASLEQAKEKLVARGEWWILAAKNAKGAKVGGECGMGNGERGIQISFALIFLKTLRLKSRGPPKKRISDGVIEMSLARRNSMRCNVQTRSAS